MANYNIKLDLSKLNKVAVTDIQGKNGRVKCVVIPVEENSVFVSEKTGNIYLDFVANERQTVSYGQTHIVKPKVGDKWRDMSQEERRNIPICGSLSPFEYGNQQQEQPSTSQSSSGFGNYSNDSNLPF